MERDDSASQPPYRRIAERIRRAILRGDFAPGDKLPSVRVLAVEEGVNPNTIQNAYGLLEREGWIDQRHGAGNFVREQRTLPADERRERVAQWIGRARAEAKLVGLSDAEWRELLKEAGEEIPLSRKHRS